MQGHRATITSMSELFDLDHGSSSSNTSVDQQFLWDDIQDPEQTQVLENHPSRTSMNPFNHEQQNLFEDRGNAHISSMFSLDNVQLNPQLGQGSSSRSFPVNLNDSPVFIGQGSESSPLVEVPEIFRPDASDFQSTNFSEGSSSGPSSSTEGRHLPCKRKSFHVENGESSSGPSNPGLPEVTEPRLTLGGSGRTERLRRNFRLLINSLGQNDQDSPAPYSDAQSRVPSSGIIMPENIDTVGNDADALPQPPALHIPPPLPPNGLSVRWNRGRNSASSSSREGGSTSNTNHQANILEHPMFVSGDESGGFVQNPVVSGNVPGVSRSGIPSDTHQSSSQTTRQMQYPRRLSEYGRRSLSSVGSESDTIGHNINFAAPSGAAEYPRRLSEYVRRSLSSVGSESDNFAAPSGAAAAAPQEIAVPSRSSGSRGRHALPLRSAYAERQGDHDVGLPYSIRSLTAASEGRRRLVYEIRSVLDMMRRGEGLRFEDFMILDQSVFLGVGDMHDRHRDMRLDVDNMSYEELLALEERIGNVNTGLSEETILTRMKQHKCVITIDHTLHNETEPCSICREEYKDGEDVGTLECRHDFHRDCIKQWLMQKNICPICKTTGLKT